MLIPLSVPPLHIIPHVSLVILRHYFYQVVQNQHYNEDDSDYNYDVEGSIDWDLILVAASVDKPVALFLVVLWVLFLAPGPFFHVFNQRSYALAKGFSDLVDACSSTSGSVSATALGQEE